MGSATLIILFSELHSLFLYCILGDVISPSQSVLSQGKRPHPFLLSMVAPEPVPTSIHWMNELNKEPQSTSPVRFALFRKGSDSARSMRQRIQDEKRADRGCCSGPASDALEVLSPHSFIYSYTLRSSHLEISPTYLYLSLYLFLHLVFVRCWGSVS